MSAVLAAMAANRGPEPEPTGRRPPHEARRKATLRFSGSPRPASYRSYVWGLGISTDVAGAGRM